MRTRVKVFAREWARVGKAASARRLECALLGLQILRKINVGDLAAEASTVGIGDIAKAHDGEALFGEAQNGSAVTEEGAIVFHDWQTTVSGQIEAKSIANLLAVI
jgi:hypothetical protein